MRFVIELPPTIARKLAERLEAGVYSSLDAAAAEAFARFLEESGGGESTMPGGAGAELGVGSELSTLPGPSTAEGISVTDSSHSPPWMWGMVNRVFPLKLAVRVCAVLCKDGAISLTALRSRSAELAATLGARLQADDRKSGRLRNENRSVGLPLRKPIDKAKLRFAMQFVGRRTPSGRFSGGVFEMGLIGPVDGKNDRVAPTAAGWAFAALPSPVLDHASTGDRNLSIDESRFYIEHAAMRVPAERAAFMSILSALSEGPLSPDEIARRTRVTTAPGMGDAVAVTARAGAIGRLLDTDALHREANGRSAVLKMTDFGRASLELLERGADA